METLEIRILKVKNLYLNNKNHHQHVIQSSIQQQQQQQHHQQTSTSTSSSLTSTSTLNSSPSSTSSPSSSTSPKLIKLKVGTGRIGGWIKKYSSIDSISPSMSITNSCIDINWNWEFSLKYKSKYQYLFIKIMEDNFLSSLIGECKIDVLPLYNMPSPQVHYLTVPIISNFGNIVPYQHYHHHQQQPPSSLSINVGELHMSVVVHSKQSLLKSISISSTNYPQEEEMTDQMNLDDQVVPNSNVTSSSSSSPSSSIMNSIFQPHNNNSNNSVISFANSVQKKAGHLKGTLKDVFKFNHHHHHSSNNNNNNRQHNCNNNNNNNIPITTSKITSPSPSSSSSLSIYNEDLNPFSEKKTIVTPSIFHNNIINNNGNNNSNNNGNNGNNYNNPFSSSNLPPLKMLQYMDNNGEETSILIKEMKSFLIREDLKKTSLGHVPEPSQADHLSLVIVQCNEFDHYFSRETLTTFATEEKRMLSCRVKIGMNDSPKETIQKPIDQLLWKQYFDISLSHPLQRYTLNTQMMTIHLLDHSTTPPTIIGETKPIDLFSIQRDRILELNLSFNFYNRDLVDENIDPTNNSTTNNSTKTNNNNSSIHILLKYSTGTLTLEEASELFYQSVCANDNVLTESLLRHQVNVNHVFRENKHLDKSSYTTPLIKAAKHGNIPLIKSLLKLGAHVDHTDYEGYTALMRAVQYEGIFQLSNINVIKLLLNYGANPTLKNLYGDDIFKFCNNKEMKYFLQSSIQNEFYEIKTLLCPKCNYLEFPLCHEQYLYQTTLQDGKCGCKIRSNCLSCEHSQLQESTRIISSTQLTYLANNYSRHNGREVFQISPNQIAHCSICKSFGFLDDNQMILDTNNNTNNSNSSQFISHLPFCPIPNHLESSKVILSLRQVDTLLQLTKKGLISKINNIYQDPSYYPSSTSSPSSSYSPRGKPLQLLSLPEEIMITILGFVGDAQDLFNCQQVCHYFNQLLQDDMFWKSKLNQSWSSFQDNQTLSLPSSLPISTFKQLFKHYYKLQEWIRILLLEETFKPRYQLYTAPFNSTSSSTMIVELSLTANKYLFNKDGLSFNFDNQFKLYLEFSDIKTLKSVEILATNQSTHLIADLCSLMGLPSHLKRNGITQDIIANHQGTATIRLSLQMKAINTWIQNYLNHMIPGFHSFLMIRDDVGGSIILDFYYYDIILINLNK